jgi:hypothetical protein
VYPHPVVPIAAPNKLDIETHMLAPADTKLKSPASVRMSEVPSPLNAFELLSLFTRTAVIGIEVVVPRVVRCKLSWSVMRSSERSLGQRQAQW